MRTILLLVLLVGCKKEDWAYQVIICPKDSNNCQKGSIIFPTLEDCEYFAREATKLQPGVGRICVKGGRPYGVYE